MIEEVADACVGDVAAVVVRGECFKELLLATGGLFIDGAAGCSVCAVFAAGSNSADEGLGIALVLSVSCVWIRVFTTSSGVVMAPARPPAMPPVASSNPTPMSLFWPTYSWAIVCSFRKRQTAVRKRVSHGLTWPCSRKTGH